jgi:hypothetical protein
MEHTENTDQIIFKEEYPVASSTILSNPSLHGVELSSLHRFVLIFAVIVTCFLILLWSRLELNEAQVALGKAQTTYKKALEENQRLQVELSMLTSPSSIHDQIKTWELERNNKVVDIFEVNENE